MSPVGYKPMEDLYHWPRFRSGKSSDYKTWRKDRKKEVKFLMSELSMSVCRGFSVNAGEPGWGRDSFNMKNWWLSGFIWGKKKNPTNSYLCLLLTWLTPTAISRGHWFSCTDPSGPEHRHTPEEKRGEGRSQLLTRWRLWTHSPSTLPVRAMWALTYKNLHEIRSESLFHSPGTTGLAGAALPNPAYCWQKSLEGPHFLPCCEKQVLHHVWLPAGSKSNLSQQEFIQGLSLKCLWRNKDLRSFCSNTNVSKSFLTQESRRFYFCRIALDDSQDFSSAEQGFGVPLLWETS